MPNQNDYVRTKIFHSKSKRPLVKFGAMSGGCVFSVAVLSLALLSGCDKQVTKKPDESSTPNPADMAMTKSDVTSIAEEDIFKEDDVKDYETLLDSIKKGYIDNATFNNDELKQWVTQLTKAETSLNCKVLGADTIKPMINDTNLFVSGVNIDDFEESTKGYFSSANEILSRISSTLNLVKDFRIADIESFGVGSKVRVPVEITPDGVTGSFKYKTSDSSVVVVDNEGMLTGVSKGSALITVISDTGITRTTKVVVSSASAITSEGTESSSSSSSSVESSSSKSSGSNGSSSSGSSSSNNGSGSSSSSSSSSTSSSSSDGSGSSYKPSGNGGNSGSSKPSHSHSYSSKTVKATCTSDGYTVHTCSCGDNYTDSYTNATGHKWSDWKTVKKATTSSEGKKQRTCSSCGKTESKSIAKLQSSSSSGEHRITGARKAVYSYNGSHGDKWSSVNLVDLINEERAKEGLGKLEWTADLYAQDVKDDPELLKCFSSKCFDSNGKFDPYRLPEVREPLEGAQKMANWGYATHGGGVGCSCVGESHGAYTIEEALRRQVKGYMKSAGHREILMKAGSHRVTAAYAIGDDGTVYTAIRVGG